VIKKILSFSTLFLSFLSYGEIKELTILHTNDLHSHLFPHIETWIS